MKLAKLLIKIEKIRRMIKSRDEGLYEHIKLFGIQVYCKYYAINVDLKFLG